MTPQQFIKKWKPAALTERAAAQSHFIDLCALVGHADPVEADPTGESFAFEKGVTKTGGGDGFADVWKQGFFAWEYKKKKRNLDDALAQLVRYAAALENPPLQVACDTDRFLIRTAWTNTVAKIYEFTLDDLAEPKTLDILHSVFFDPDKLRPKETRAGITREAADKFSTIALRLQGHGTPEEIAHFVNQLVFCFFAHSVKLLPEGFFPRLLQRASETPDNAQRYFNGLFAAMEKGGEFDLTRIAHFNGGLFDGRKALPLRSGDVGLLIAAGGLDWSQIDPTIFGTLFERFLDPEKRGQIGAHYTDPDKIMTIVEPVILRPLRTEWEAARAEIAALLEGRQKPPMRAKTKRRMTPHAAAEEVRSQFLERLRAVSILDPACGSGNFLYLALQGVKDIELRANLECEALGLEPRVPVVGPEIVHGIEINPLAAELARTTIWIGDIQWGIRNAIYARPEPILRALDAIECRDALIARVEPKGPPQTQPSPPGLSRGSTPSGNAAKQDVDGRNKSGHDDGVVQASPQTQPSPPGLSRGSTPSGDAAKQGVDGRNKSGHDDGVVQALPQTQPSPPGLSRGSTPSGDAAKQGVDGRNESGHDDGGAKYVEAEWPPAEFIVGNPPFLGTKKLIAGLGEHYSEALRSTFEDRVSRFSDLVCWWFEKARAQIISGSTKRVGLVATNSIRGGKNRGVLDRISRDLEIFEAWSDEPWVVDGANVRVSLIAFGQKRVSDVRTLNGRIVDEIHADLTASSKAVGSDLTKARRIQDNKSIGFIGTIKAGPFDISGTVAREWLKEPKNPNGKSNAEVLKPWFNTLDVVRRIRDSWVVDFGVSMSEQEAALFATPFQHVKTNVKPVRAVVRRARYRDFWWLFAEPCVGMRTAIARRSRYIATPTVSKHRVFVWVDKRIQADHQLVAIARDDDTSFGILHSRFHESWSLRLGTSLEDRPRYTPTTTFETFPFPEGLTPNIPAKDTAGDPRAIAIAKAAKRLDELRNAWLNPPDLVRVEPEVVAGYPDRILPKDAQAAAILRERTLTNLYNARPQWLADAHRDLDAAVAAAYGWPADISEEDALAKLLELNLSRAAAGHNSPPDLADANDEEDK